jgi:hypothetical protein
MRSILHAVEVGFSLPLLGLMLSELRPRLPTQPNAFRMAICIRTVISRVAIVRGSIHALIGGQSNPASANSGHCPSSTAIDRL